MKNSLHLKKKGKGEPLAHRRRARGTPGPYNGSYRGNGRERWS